MISIAICDNEKQFVKRIKKWISEYFGVRGGVCKVDSFSSERELPYAAIRRNQYQVVFLDVGMGDMDGMVAARKIRACSEDVLLVFVTDRMNYAVEGYKLGVVRYILKDSSHFEYEFTECMDAIVKMMQYGSAKKVFSFVEGKTHILVNDVIYMESDLHKVKFFIRGHESENHTMYATLNEIEKQYPACGFVRVHQSFLVNLSYVLHVSRYKVVLVNGTELPISKNRYKEVERALVAHQGPILENMS